MTWFNDLNSDSILALIALSAIISPIIVEVIDIICQIWFRHCDNVNRLKEITVLHEKEILEDALAAVGSLLGSPDSKTYSECGRRILLALPYIGDNTPAEIIQISEGLHSQNQIETEDLIKLSELLTRELRTRLQDIKSKQRKHMLHKLIRAIQPKLHG